MPETTDSRVVLPSDGKQRTEANAKTAKQETVDHGWQKESVPKESHAVSNMTLPRKAKGKSNVIDQVLLRWDLDHQPKTVKDRERCSKRTSPERFQFAWKTTSAFVFQLSGRKM